VILKTKYPLAPGQGLREQIPRGMY